MRTDTKQQPERTAALWDSEQTAAYLGIPVRTLDQWSYQHIGPAFSKLGKHRRYRQLDVDAYVDANRRGGSAA